MKNYFKEMLQLKLTEKAAKPIDKKAVYYSAEEIKEDGNSQLQDQRSN